MNMDRAMVLFASRLPLETPALGTDAGRQFPSEILLAIFENVQDAATLRQLRLVNSQFEELVTPISCRQVVLSPELVAQYGLNKAWSDHSMLQVNLTTHTQQVIIKKKLDWLLVKRLLSTLKNLESLLWIEWPSTNGNDRASLLAFEEIRDQLPHIKYQVESFTAVAWRLTRLGNHPNIRYHNRYFSMSQLFPGQYSFSQDIEPRYLPTAQFNSLKFVNWDEYSYSYAKPLLLGNAGLKTLHIAGDLNWTNIEEEDIGDEDFLPPIEELNLKSYEWDHSPSIIESFWNWSNLASLELECVPIIRFCRTVSVDKLIQLKKFRTDGFCFDESNWDQATELLSNMVSNIRGLHELSLTCNVGYQECISSVLRHSKTLRTLEVRSYCDLFPKDLSDKVLEERVTMDQLNSIRTMCPHLTTLVFDLRPPLNDLGGLNLADENYVALLAEFRNLRRLKVFAWTGRRGGEDGNEPTMARHYSDARGWNERLASMKQGAKFEHIILENEIWKLQSDRAEDASFAEKLSVMYGKL